jgi:hypothetical protein
MVELDLELVRLNIDWKKKKINTKKIFEIREKLWPSL